MRPGGGSRPPEAPPFYLHENMDLSELGKDRVYEFVYVFAPMRIKGATGSPGRPIAMV